MKKITMLLILSCVAVAFAQPKQRIAVLPTVGGRMEPEKQILLTDKVRELAAKNLPTEKFVILKQDVIIKRIGGEEEFYKSCKEGVCIGDLAKRVDSDYGARCEVVKVDNRLVLKFELYSVSEDAIFETFIDHSAKDIFGMLAVLEQRLPQAFKKMVDVYNAEAAKAAPPPEPPKTVLAPPLEPPKPMSPPEPPKTNTVAAPSGTTFVDKRDGKTYKKVTIGKQVWMAENLNYAASGSKCYKNKAECEKYGRLYDWKTAMNGSPGSSSNPSGVQGACPAGWHLPSDAEWKTLENTVGGSKKAGTKLKSTSGWRYKEGRTGTDEYGFSAFPCGDGTHSYFYSGFNNAGGYGSWWSATGYGPFQARCRRMGYNDESVTRGSTVKTNLFSVRCVQD